MGLIIPTGFHIFQRGRLNHQPVIYNHFGAISPNLGQLRYVFWDLRLNFGYTDNRYGTFLGETFDLKTISHQWSRWFRRSNLRIYIYTKAYNYCKGSESRHTHILFNLRKDMTGESEKICWCLQICLATPHPKKWFGARASFGHTVFTAKGYQTI